MIPAKTVRLHMAIPEAHKKVFDCLLAVNEKSMLNATLRVAGGWVRDTILGVPSQDIDIAIETPPGAPAVSGERFAREVSAYQAEQGGQGRTVSVIRVNPALSKHIETATVCVNDLPVEFCALRTDDYCDDSRIPIVRSATPQEDALRRDFTINALFYNLHTCMVEDFTTGLDDLEKRCIRCPLEPSSTFSDDPLRLLRGVRFVGQLGGLGFQLDASIPRSVDQHLLDILLEKVSRERVGKEFTKMMCCPHPEQCISIMMGTKILQQIILVEVYMKQIEGKKQNSSEVDHSVHLADIAPGVMEAVRGLNLAAVPQLSSPTPLVAVEPLQKMGLALFFLLVPFFRGVPSAVMAERVYAALLNGLKLPNASFTAVRRMIDAYNELLAQQFCTSSAMEASVSTAAQMKVFGALAHLNDKHVTEGSLKAVMLAYLLLEEREDLLASGDAVSARQQVERVWEGLSRYPALLNAFSLVIPVKGNELKGLIGVEPQQIGTTLLRMRQQMVLAPQTTREELIVWLKAGMPSP